MLCQIGTFPSPYFPSQVMLAHIPHQWIFCLAEVDFYSMIYLYLSCFFFQGYYSFIHSCIPNNFIPFYHYISTIMDQEFSLPITKYRDEIVDMVRENAVSVICGETGCGKTTQVPQFLFPHYRRIMISQPRRISAITLA